MPARFLKYRLKWPLTASQVINIDEMFAELYEDTAAQTVATRLTTAQRDSLVPVEGMLVYNLTTRKFQGYEAGSWVNLV